MLLPEVNVWLALSFDCHVHHNHAIQWFEGNAESGCCFCRMTQQGFLRLATNPKVFPEDVLTMAKAWKAYDQILEDSRISFSSEPADLEQVWRRFTSGKTFSPKVWNDAYLAAFTLKADLKLVTFDKGFRQYKGLALEVLSSGV